MTNDHKINLAENIEEIEQHQKIAPDRLLAYYDSETDEPEKFSGNKPKKLSDIEQSPPQLLIEDAADIVDYELTLREVESRIHLNGSGSSTRVHYILFGVCAELLVHAYCLEDDPHEFIEELREKGTPSIEDGRQKLCSELGDRLYNSEMRRLSLVLKLLHAKRNNAVHTGFHKQSHYAHVAPTYEVLQFLFDYLSETPLDIVPRLGEATTKLRERVG